MVFGPGRQPPVPEQVADFFERRAAFGVGEVMDVDAVIREHAARAVEIADGGFAGDDVLEAGLRGRWGHILNLSVWPCGQTLRFKM